MAASLEKQILLNHSPEHFVSRFQLDTFLAAEQELTLEDHLDARCMLGIGITNSCHWRIQRVPSMITKRPCRRNPWWSARAEQYRDAPAATSFQELISSAIITLDFTCDSQTTKFQRVQARFGQTLQSGQSRMQFNLKTYTSYHLSVLASIERTDDDALPGRTFQQCVGCTAERKLNISTSCLEQSGWSGWV